jgi:four helix bundle protein
MTSFSHERLRVYEEALECGGCLDIAVGKSLVMPGESSRGKARLLAIANMLAGLRKSWDGVVVRETPSSYGQGDAQRSSGFHHERLDVYRVSLQVTHWLEDAAREQQLPDALYRKLDTASTSIVLNIAEGNGKYSMRDHRRFLRITRTSTVKLAAQLDISVRVGALSEVGVREVKSMLFRLGSMTAALEDRVRA